MKRLALLIIPLLLSGCLEEEERPVARAALPEMRSAAMMAPAPAGIAGMAGAPAAKLGDRTIALSHDIEIELPANAVAAAWNAAQARCRTLNQAATPAGEPCQLIDARLTEGDSPHASLTARLAPEVVTGFLDSAAAAGRVVSRADRSEDLGAPITDLAARRRQLESQRTRLLELQGKANVVADLIQITRELSQVQSDLEMVARSERDLASRTDRERVQITFRGPVLGPATAEGWSHLGARLGRALSSSALLAITAAVFALPWVALGLVVALPPLALLVWLARLLWRRRR